VSDRRAQRTPGRSALAAITAGALLTLTACSSDGANDTPAPAAEATQSPLPTHDPGRQVAPPAVRGQVGEDPVPADRSGGLTVQSVPQAGDLGPGWQVYNDPGGHDAGFAGNGTWVRERDPQDVVEGLRPVGCKKKIPAVSLPTPVNALEGTYTGPDGASAVSLTVELPSAAASRTFLAGLTRLVKACGDSSTTSLRISVLKSTATLLTDRRREPGATAPALEVVAAEDARVGLLVVLGASESAQPGATAMEKSVRAALHR
jgi:hypothetical protein